jgi:DNA-binding transcriptional LysR family regulator
MDDDSAATQARQLVSRLRFRHLRLLLEVQRGGSLRTAAQAMNLTQPALGKALSEIESAFGFALFTRTARGLTPTAQGEVALRGAAMLLKELAHLQREAAAGDRFAAHLRIGAPPFVAQAYLPQVLGRLVHRDTPVNVLLLEERVPVLMQALVAGEVDALVTTYPLEMPAGGASPFAFEKLFEAQIHVVASVRHPLAKARKVSWAQLAAARWVLPARGAMARRVVEDCFLRAGEVPPVPVVESASPVTNLRLAAAGVGVTVAPDISVASSKEADLRHVVRLKVDPPVPPGPVAPIYRSAVDHPRVAVVREALGLAQRHARAAP